MSSQTHSITSKCSQQSSSPEDELACFGPNFAQSNPSQTDTQTCRWQIPIQYEHEVYLQLTSGDNNNAKTANQVYMEVMIHSSSSI